MAKRATPKAAPKPAPPPPPPKGTAKRPRGTGARRAAPIISPDVLIPRRAKVGAPLKVVERTKRPANASPPLWQRALQNPHELYEAYEKRPIWVDDLAALFLISLGAVSLLTLLNSAPTAAILSLSDQWADFISQLFGRLGALLFSMGLIGIGVLIVLPRAGIKIHLTWRRLLSAEIAFLAFLALLHLLAGDPEPRALARSGLGGGHMGWALGELMAKLFGSGLAVLIYFGVICLAVGAIFGVRRKHIKTWGIAFSKRLEQFAEGLKRRATAPRPPRPSPMPHQNRFLRRASTPPISAPAPESAPPATFYREPAHADLTQPAVPAADLTQPATPPIAPAPPAPEQPAMPPPLRGARRTQTQAQPTVAAAPLTPTAPPTPSTLPLSAPFAPPQTPPPAPPAKIAAEVAEPLPPIEEPEPLPVPITPIKTASIPLPSTPAPAAPPERRRRHFKVEDFQELRANYPRPNLPPLTLLRDTDLEKPTEQEINSNARIIEDTLLEFDIDVEVVDVKVGPTVTQYAVQPFREVTTEGGEVVTQRVRVNKIAALERDLALALAAKRLRIQPYVPGFSYMGIEVPNRRPSVVALRPVMESEAFVKVFRRAEPDAPNGMREVPLAVPLGRDVAGESVAVDLALMPHLLIAGTTGSGKSVCITAMITSLVMNNLPNRLKLILLDPKMVELSRFNGLPHLLGPVETEIERIVGVLRWATREMDRRYKLLEAAAARNIEVYNRSLGEHRAADHLPYIVIIADEIGDLMLSRPEEVERTITRLAQMARAVGIHLVIATQRPSTDIITGLIKANFPARISFAVTSGIDSRVVLDSVGAETLMGRGDMLYVAPDAAVPRRVQGCFVSDDEIEAVMDYWRKWTAEQGLAPTDSDEYAPWDRGVSRREALGKTDPLLEEAIDLVVRRGEASTSILLRGLAIDYPRAAKLMDLMSELGILGAPKEDGRAREVTIKAGSDPYKKLMQRLR
ncbi:MAG: DNA translocase FtsK [Chloroflexi bacterium CFX4]|nr:DNA translocase FtsK [Chloroflexi bacterium CFX4]MDL1921563.1 DNA translocase FtsK [Chloroflexi bacterium CFX3]